MWTAASTQLRLCLVVFRGYKTLQIVAKLPDYKISHLVHKETQQATVQLTSLELLCSTIRELDTKLCLPHRYQLLDLFRPCSEIILELQAVIDLPHYQRMSVRSEAAVILHTSCVGTWNICPMVLLNPSGRCLTL